MENRPSPMEIRKSIPRNSGNYGGQRKTGGNYGGRFAIIEYMN